ncbi:hypothetical protein TR51_11905 [Kitasatospora griseola]|uniref:Gram-positive cocci surface proteins LPxTG domain-containing protein n=1 Tax=Kitasatospora griseola TaxID=2064 RepID=A0A0D0NCJ8_KITGR|nr:hypothetical protein TR51_11905 [Kitasatospora griseola]
MRALRAGVLLGAAALPLAAPAAPAFAAPGDNGDVKIHSTGVPFNDPRDETKVCKFYLDAVNFDTVQLVSWEIDQQQPPGTRTLSGSIVLSGGAGHTTNLSLPNGTYKLIWNFVGETGQAKQKVFAVDCGPGAQNSPPPVPPAQQGHSAEQQGHSAPPQVHQGHVPKGGVAAGEGGGSHGLNPAEIAVGGALLAGGGWLVARRLRRSRR